MTKTDRYYKVLTHDLRPPIQGGDPLFAANASFPLVLPAVDLDTSSQECGAGWNFSDEPHTALRIAGFWPNGRSSRLFEVMPSDDRIERGDEHRCSVLTITGEVDENGVGSAIDVLSRTWFGDDAEVMAREQKAWRWVLGVGFDHPKAKQIRERAWGAWGAWGARDARGARGAWDAWDAWGARGARGALVVFYACVVKGWVPLPKSYEWLTAMTKDLPEEA